MRAQMPLTLKFMPKEKTTKFYYIKMGVMATKLRR